MGPFTCQKSHIHAYAIKISTPQQTFGSILLGPVPARATPLTLKTTLRHLGFDIDFDFTLIIGPTGPGIAIADLQ
jgi:hypothetical protein